MGTLKKERLTANLRIAIESVGMNKLRSFLTALGIIFGVAAVITMMAIGVGAQREIMKQMELVGANNINITAFTRQEEGKVNLDENEEKEKKQQNFLSPGLNLSDVENIRQRIPGIEYISPEIIIDAKAIRTGIWKTTQLIGIKNDFFKVFNFELEAGKHFNSEHHSHGLPVCIIGHNIYKKLFNQENPIGNKIKVNGQWLTVYGVLKEQKMNAMARENEDLGIRNYNMDIYIPLQTMLIRYENRSIINKFMIKRSSGKPKNSQTDNNYHQLDKIVIKVNESQNLRDIASITSKILARRHNKVIDYKITIPELLIKQQQESKRIFNIVLAVIAGISLLVGGIGIMNIMLASVMERIREIGLRIALGAKQSDIVQQFLFEAMTISIIGGITGIILGFTLSNLVTLITEIQTVITWISVLASFAIALSIGLIFGIMPARKASKQNPINSLRHE